AMLPIYENSHRLRWNDEVNAPVLSKKDSIFKGLEVNDENVLKVIAHDYKVNPGIYMTIEEVREDIGGSRSQIRSVIESLEQKKLIVTHKDHQGKIVLVKANYQGLKQAFPKEYYRWFPDWYEDSDKF
ncbi:MAG TPA: hypothetical protein VGB37_16230, partial [Candidatus Lokiarchaeia archaeon]